MMKPMLEDCKKKEGATDQDVDNFLADGSLTTRPQKCVASCILTQFSMVSIHSFSFPLWLRTKIGLRLPNRRRFQVKEKDGKDSLCVECAMSMARMGITDEAKLKTIREVLEACQPVQNADRCDFAADLSTCLDTESIKRGIDKDNF